MKNNFDDHFKGFRKTASIMMLIGVVGNLVFWGGLIALVFWLLSHFAVI